jgi:hypothetical protein
MNIQLDTHTNLVDATNVEELNDITASLPSIASSFMLVNVTIGYPSMEARDRDVSKATEAAFGAETGTVKSIKSLLGKLPELEAIKSFAAVTRQWHAHQTLPWHDRGSRLALTSKIVSGYLDELTAKQTYFQDKLVPAFAAKYEWAGIKAQASLGDMYKPEDFPALSSILRKFYFNIDVEVIKDISGDPRTALGAQANEILYKQCINTANARVSSAMNDIWQRAFKSLSSMSDKLDYTDTGEVETYITKNGATRTRKVGVKTFHDTLVTHVHDVIGIMNTCNLTNDPHMQLMQRRLENTLRGVTPDVLRDDKFVRAETKRSVDEIIAALPSLDF